MTIDMHDSLKEAHGQTCTKPLAAIERLHQIATRHSPEISQRLTERAESLRTMVYKLLVIGRPNSGKSTLLNALLLPLEGQIGGLELPPLPVNAYRTTALPAWIGYAKEPSCTVWSFDGSQEPKSLAWYQRESELEGDLERDEHRFQGVAEFELGLPSQLCSAAVMFGDSAGLDCALPERFAASP
jgi:hypothetical protein